jgi:transformation/transcription domain-associated protein
LGGLFLACGVPSLAEKALDYVRSFCRRAFALELGRDENAILPDKYLPEALRTRRFLPVTTAIAACFVSTLAESAMTARPSLCELLATILADFQDMVKLPEFAALDDGPRSIDRMIMTIAHRFVNLCHEEDWSKKMAGVVAIRVFIEKAELSRKLVLDLEIDFVRALIFCLRDSPKDPHKSTNDVLELIKVIIRTCHASEDGQAKETRLVETFLLELNSQKKISRDAAHECIATLAQVLGKPITEVIGPSAKLRVLDPNAGPIFSKPLRARPFPMQVGNIDAIVYLLDLRPSLIESTEEFTRLLHEVLALADADDAGLLNKPVTHRQEEWLKKLRIACLRLLRSAVAHPEHLAGSPALRSR